MGHFGETGFFKYLQKFKFTERKPCNISLTSKELNTKNDNCDLQTAEKLDLFIKTKASVVKRILEKIICLKIGEMDGRLAKILRKIGG